MKVGVVNTPVWVPFIGVGYEETLTSCFLLTAIPTTDPPPCGGGDWVEGLCCDNPTNGTEWDRGALPLAGTNLLQGSVVSWRAKGGDCCVLLGRAACEAMGCPPPSLFHSRVLIRLLHQPCGSCHTRERDIKGRRGCHSTCVTLGGPASS